MAAKKIAFVANTSWSIYKFRLYLIEKLLEKEFTIYVLAPRDPYTGKFENLPGLTYIELLHFNAKSLSPLKDLELKKELTAHYKTIRPDLIFHYTIKANIFGTSAAAAAAIPSISVITGLGYAFAGKGLLQFIARILYRSQLKHSAEVWFLNTDDQNIFIDQKLVPKQKTFLLPGEGVAPDHFPPAPYTQTPGPAKAKVTFLLIGRIIRHKGIYEFVQAAETLKKQGLSIECQLLGFFDSNNPVAIGQEEIDTWSKQNLVTYLGHTDDVAPYIKEADCVVLPSYREGLPLSLLEGASMCKALIATDTAGCRAIIQEGINGYLCREKDASHLAEKMSAYYHLPPAEKTKMGLEGRKIIMQTFTNDIVTGIYLEKITTLTAHAHPAVHRL